MTMDYAMKVYNRALAEESKRGNLYMEEYHDLRAQIKIAVNCFRHVLQSETIPVEQKGALFEDLFEFADNIIAGAELYRKNSAILKEQMAEWDKKHA